MVLKNSWAAEKRNMQSIYYGILGRKTRIIDIPNENGEVAFTSADGDIHVVHEHHMMDSMPTENHAAFRLGLFAHEMLHQVFTDFEGRTKRARRFESQLEQNMYCQISNIIEDGFIEHWGSSVFGGYLLDAMRYMIAWIYDQTPSLDEAKNPLQQYMTAMLLFEANGSMKGNFTFPEAEKAFVESAPWFMQGIKEQDPKKRLMIFDKVYEISKPLWEDHIGEAEEMEKTMQELLGQIAEMIKELGMDMSQLPRKNSDAYGTLEISPDIDPDERNNDARQQAMLEAIKQALEDSMNGETGDEGDGSEDGDGTDSSGGEKGKKPGKGGKSVTITVPVPDGDESSDGGDKTDGTDGKEGKGSGDGKDAEGDRDGKDGKESDSKGKSSGKQSGKGKASGGKGSKPSGKGSSGTPSVPNGGTSVTPGDGGMPSQGTESVAEGTSVRDGEDVMPTGKGSVENAAKPKSGMRPTPELSDKGDDLKLSDEFREEMQEDLSRADQEVTKEEKEKEATKVPLEEVHMELPTNVKNCSMKNTVMERGNADTYNEIVSKYAGKINNLSHSLERIFKADQEEKMYRPSGKISLDRMSTGRVTTRIFERKSLPENTRDLAVFMLIDMSGSMSGRKVAVEREACIALAETFAKLKLPLYVMGFSADIKADADHYHFVRWANKASERVTLTNIEAMSENFDGYSIRYAAEILKKRHESHKLLLVLSDGQPACHTYYHGVPGIADTKNAIREARKKVSVMGIAIGNNDTDLLYSMYGRNFIHISNVNEMFNGIGNGLKEVVRHWDA